MTEVDIFPTVGGIGYCGKSWFLELKTSGSIHWEHRVDEGSVIENIDMNLGTSFTDTDSGQGL